MFVQHHPATFVSAPVIVHQNKDFELIVDAKSQDHINGKIVFNYLNQSFESTINITATSIQIQSQYPFSGIQASAPVLSQELELERAYLVKGSVSKLGVQHIVWLMLDTIHLYNVVRLKPNTMVSLYREVFNEVKALEPELIFGKIPLHLPIAQLAAKKLGQKAKLLYKYVYGNPLDLLASLQQLLSNYPQPVLTLAPHTLTRDIIGTLS